MNGYEKFFKRIFLIDSSRKWERDFETYFSAKYILLSKYSFLLGLALVMLDALFDYFIQREPSLNGNVIRFYIVVPLFVIGYYAFKLPGFREKYQLYVTIWSAIVVPIIALLLSMIDRDGGQGLTSWVGAFNFTFIVVYIYLILGIRIIYSLWLGVYSYFVFMAFIFSSAGDDVQGFIIKSFHCFTVLILGIFIGYVREMLIRKEYGLMESLSREKDLSKTLMAQLNIQKDVFISHSSLDGGKVYELAELLKNKGVTTWYAPRDIPAGMPWRDAIVSGISASNLVIFILTKNSSNSEQVIKEMDIARSYSKKIVPVIVENGLRLGSSLEYELAGIQHIEALKDINSWDNEKIAKHIKDMLLSHTEDRTAIKYAVSGSI